MDGGKGNQGRAGGGADSGPGLSRVRDGQSTRPHRSSLMQRPSILLLRLPEVKIDKVLCYEETFSTMIKLDLGEFVAAAAHRLNQGSKVSTVANPLHPALPPSTLHPI